MAVSPIDQTLKLNKRITRRIRKIFRKYFWELGRFALYP
jgi:hypothetical protein